MSFILILEDDQTTSERLQTLIERELDEPDLSIDIIETERDFRFGWLEKLRAGDVPAPDVIVIDIMLLWSFPERNADPRPLDVVEGGFHLAGIRCLDAIRAEPRLRRCKCLFYTALTSADLTEMGANLPGDIRLVTKDQNGLEVARFVKSWLIPLQPR